MTFPAALAPENLIIGDNRLATCNMYIVQDPEVQYLENILKYNTHTDTRLNICANQRTTVWLFLTHSSRRMFHGWQQWV